MTPHTGWHGEYKVPVGKLVLANLTVARGQLCNLELSGDFFSEPEETLERMVAAVEDLPCETSAAHLTVRLSAAARGAVLLGVTPEDFAIALRRAVEGAGGYAG